MMISFNLPLPPTTNHLFINRSQGGRARSKKYNEWIEEAGWELVKQRPKKIKGQVKLSYEFEDTGRLDLGNREKALTDLLVKHQIIEGDDRSIVRSILLDWSTNVKGVHVEIHPVGEA